MDIASLPLIVMVNFFTIQIPNHSPADIFSVQRDREGQPRGPGDNHIVFAKVGEPDKQLLVLVDAARIVGDDHRLSLSFDTQGSRRERYGLSLRPNLLEGMLCALIAIASSRRL